MSLLLEFIASHPNEKPPLIQHKNIQAPHSPREAPNNHFQWAIESIQDSKVAHPDSGAYVGPTWEPMEAKGGPLEVMTLPGSLRRGNPDNFSGQGKEQEVDDAVTPSAGRAASGEDREVEGSGEGSNFPGGIGLKVQLPTGPTSLLGQSKEAELVTVAEQGPLSQWQLMEQTISPSHGSQEPEAAEEARGEILYVHRPTNDLSSASSGGSKGNSNQGLTSVFKKQSKGAKKTAASTSGPEPSIEALTTSVVTTVEFATGKDSQTTDPTTAASTTDKYSTEEESISISWVREEKTSTADLQEQISATPTPSEGPQTTTAIIQLATTASDSGVRATEAESRSAVSESFVVGGPWTPFKDAKSKDHKASGTMDKKDAKGTSNPFGILVPGWTFGLIPSGT